MSPPVAACLPFPKYTILVSGAPGSGKTSLALPLTAALDFALISKDVIKETLYDTLEGVPNDLRISRKLGNAAMEVLWSLAAFAPKVILEANFRPGSAYERGRIQALPGSLLEVHCKCSATEAARRFALRAATPDHHPAHAAAHLTVESMAEYDRPIGVSPVIEVNTEIPVDIPGLVRKIRAHWASTPTASMPGS